jgi:hypothetical protein
MKEIMNDLEYLSIDYVIKKLTECEKKGFTKVKIIEKSFGYETIMVLVVEKENNDR